MAKEYNVIWQIEVTADSPEEAAEIALDSLMLGNALFYNVQDSETKVVYDVDLETIPYTAVESEFSPVIK